MKKIVFSLSVYISGAQKSEVSWDVMVASILRYHDNKSVSISVWTYDLSNNVSSRQKVLFPQQQ